MEQAKTDPAVFEIATNPRRYQRSRTKGATLPIGVVCVTRPGIFSNPFTPAGFRAAGYRGTDAELKAQCVEAFKVWLGPHWRNNWDGEESEKRRQRLLDALPGLRGKDLACRCRLNAVCHADILLAEANK